MAIEYRRGGRKVSASGFFDGLMDDVLDTAMSSLEEEFHAKAASIIDPETGKHSPVFVRRIGKDRLSVQTSGSDAFARELERRLGLRHGDVSQVNSPEKQRLVYFAHASEDKAIARPIAEGLLARGIDVWFDEWEIGFGDSLRRRMDEGLGDCSHFVVLLTATSINKPWVNEEVDAGLLAAVEGTAKFIGLRHQLPLEALSPLLRTRLAPEIEPNEAGIEALAAQIYGVSNKPALGTAPRYVEGPGEGTGWSPAALRLAEYFVRNSKSGHKFDPQATFAQLQEATGMPIADVRLGVLDLVGSGMLEKSKTIGLDRVWPLSDLFSTFDGFFLSRDPEADAKELATFLLNTGKDLVASSEAANELGWDARRFNPAANWLVAARIIRAYEAHGGPYVPFRLRCGDELLRFVRSL